jgi:hypothetical protein
MNCGRVEPDAVFPELRRLAASDQWQTREVAATALVEIAKVIRRRGGMGRHEIPESVRPPCFVNFDENAVG